MSMQDDLIANLRNPNWVVSVSPSGLSCNTVMQAAADEIKRLRAALAEMRELAGLPDVSGLITGSVRIPAGTVISIKVVD